MGDINLIKLSNQSNSSAAAPSASTAAYEAGARSAAAAPSASTTAYCKKPMQDLLRGKPLEEETQSILAADMPEEACASIERLLAFGFMVGTGGFNVICMGVTGRCMCTYLCTSGQMQQAQHCRISFGSQTKPGDWLTLL